MFLLSGDTSIAPLFPLSAFFGSAIFFKVLVRPDTIPFIRIPLNILLISSSLCSDKYFISFSCVSSISSINSFNFSCAASVFFCILRILSSLESFFILALSSLNSAVHSPLIMLINISLIYRIDLRKTLVSLHLNGE